MRRYALVNSKMGKVRDVAQKIASVAGVKMANACWGVPDIFDGAIFVQRVEQLR